MKALDTLLPDLSPSSSSTALALPCCTTVLPVAAAARPISTSRGSGSWQIHSLFSLSHNSINENDPGVPSPLLADRYDSTPIHRWNCFCPAAQAAEQLLEGRVAASKFPCASSSLTLEGLVMAAEDCSLQHLLLLLAFSRPPLVDDLRAYTLAASIGLSFSRS
ncbi:hypothetical protein BHM03_00021625 [Ensete ventricosum]|nr:hypothetical protein BHM03_00021625 [Ensete ventricosum]